MDDYAPIAPLCVYTIAHSDRLNFFYHLGGRGELFEGRRWVRAEELLIAAREFRMQLPIVFAAAENPVELIYHARIDSLRLGDAGTEYRFSSLTPFAAPRPRKTSLINDMTGEPVPQLYHRPYLICRTPREVKLRTQNTRK